jgi:hypothetical protein
MLKSGRTTRFVPVIHLFFEECGALPSRRHGKDTTRFLVKKYQKNPRCANGLWGYVGG